MFPKFLKIAGKNLLNFMELRGQGLEISGGINGLLVKDLAMAIGFDYEIHTPEDKEWGRRTQDGNWTGMLGMLDSGLVDMAAVGFGITEDRSNSFHLIPYSVLDVAFVVDKPGYMSDGSRLLYPFQSEVWYASVAAYLLTTLVLWLLPGRKLSISRLATNTLGMAFGNDSKTQSTSTAKKIVSSCWLMSSMLLVFSYSAVLLSSLTLPVREKGIRTVEELVDSVLNHGHKIVLPKANGFVLDMFTDLAKLTDVAQKINDNNWFFEFVNGALPQQFEHNSAYVASKLELQINYGTEPFTTKFISEDAFFVLNLGVVVRKTFCCKKKLQWFINRIMETGLYEGYVRQTSLKCSSDRPLEFEGSSITPISLANLSGIFFFLLFGLISALIVLLIEILHIKIQKVCFKTLHKN